MKFIKKLLRTIIPCTLISSLIMQTTVSAYSYANRQQEQVNVIKSSFISLHPDNVDKINDIADIVVSSDQFQKYYQYNETEALRVLKDAINDAFLPAVSELSLYSLRAGNPTMGIFYAPYSVTAVRQCETNYCGPASIVQALIGNGTFPFTTVEYALEQSQRNVATNLSFAGGATIGSMCDYMNSFYNTETCKYMVKIFTHFTYTHAQRYVYESLRLDGCPIYLLDDTSTFEYYNGNSYVHYMTISYYNGQQGIINVLDPHYDDLYYGMHTITFDEFDSSAYVGSWIIARTTDENDESNIYN